MYFEMKYFKRNTAIRFFRCEIISYIYKRKKILYTNLIQLGLYEKILMRKKSNYGTRALSCFKWTQTHYTVQPRLSGLVGTEQNCSDKLQSG